MATIKLTEVPSFEHNFKNQAVTDRINSLGLTEIYHDNDNMTILVVSDQKYVPLFLFQGNGTLYGDAPSKKVKKIRSFRKLGINSIDGNSFYKPELAWVDASCNEKIYVVDTKFNSKDNTQHVVKYDHPMYDYSNPSVKHPFTLDDVIVQLDKKKIYQFAVSESRSYDFTYGGYPVLFYAINNQGEVLEFDTKDYNNKISANPQSLTWRVTNFNQKSGFVRLTENSYYWGNREELVYAFGLNKNLTGDYFFLELVNSSSLQSSHSNWFYDNTVKQAPNKIKLEFSSHINYANSPLPKFDSAACLDDKEFLLVLIPSVNGSLDTSNRDIYWFRLNAAKDEAILLADPYRVNNIDRFDGVRNYESPVWIRHARDSNTLEDLVYMVTGQNNIKKFKLDLRP